MVEATNHHTSFGPLRQVEAGLLNVGYADIGPADGRAAVLLHGWPYDIHSYVDIVPLLASAGYRVVVPYLRGFGTTRFLSDETFRNGEQAARSRMPRPMPRTSSGSSSSPPSPRRKASV